MQVLSPAAGRAPLTPSFPDVDAAATAHPGLPFVALSRFRIANDMADAVKQAFVNRPHLVDGVAGFLRLDVISPHDCPQEIWLLTYWVDEAAFQTWHKSHMRHASHALIPKGLRLVRGSTELRFFAHVSS